MPPADSKKCSGRKIWFAASLGFAVGVVSGTAYLLLGGIYFFNVPRWAAVLFYPGFVTGYWVYDHWNLREHTSKIVGVLAVGLTYALLGALLRWVAMRLRQRRDNSVCSQENHQSGL